MIFLDTHVVVWLYAGDLDRISERVKEKLEEENLVISPMVYLELQYLFEIKRIKTNPSEILESLNAAIGLTIDNADWLHVMTESIGQNWTRDPFDRIIVAHSIIKKSPLISKDQIILENHPEAVW